MFHSFSENLFIIYTYRNNIWKRGMEIVSQNATEKDNSREVVWVLWFYLVLPSWK